jgi:SAM-dependent methyltransferase
MSERSVVCPGCKDTGVVIFYELRGVPVHSVLLLSSREEAMNYPRGDISLGFCQSCGFISNVAFDASLHEYSTRYESTQGYSSTFNAFHHKLAKNLIDRFDLHNRDIIEIGCGQGEFLNLLCELGGNRGIGFDPAFIPEHHNPQVENRATIIPDFYSEKYKSYQGDFICCKMTLEHIHQTEDFLKNVRNSIGENLGSTVFFQVPNAGYVFGDVAFWDIYYEHCSYFHSGSIGRLFRRVGFKVVDIWTDYDDQYLMIAALPSKGHGSTPLPEDDDLSTVSKEISRFSNLYPHKVAAWKQKLLAMHAQDSKIILWGGGSKAVAFLTTLGLEREIEYVVDINPNKTGTFLAGTGQEIVSPRFLTDYRPDVVVIMNPVYCQEIRNQLLNLGLKPELLTVQSI